MVAAVVLLVSTAAIPASAIHQPLDSLLAMYVAGIASALVLALVATGFGCLAGALGTGGDDAVSLGDLLSVAFVVAGVIAFAAPAVDATALYATPVLGQVLLIRDLVAGRYVPLTIAIAVASALVTFAVLVRWSGRLLGDQQRVLRPPGDLGSGGRWTTPSTLPRGDRSRPVPGGRSEPPGRSTPATYTGPMRRNPTPFIATLAIGGLLLAGCSSNDGCRGRRTAEDDAPALQVRLRHPGQRHLRRRRVEDHRVPDR